MKRSIVASIAVFALVVAGCASDDVSQDVGQGPIPDEVAALIDQWKLASRDLGGRSLHTNGVSPVRRSEDHG